MDIDRELELSPVQLNYLYQSELDQHQKVDRRHHLSLGQLGRLTGHLKTSQFHRTVREEDQLVTIFVR